MAGITDIPGLKVGHYTDYEAVTGCTVVLCGPGAVAGVSVRGGAPGTRETDLLRPSNLVEQVQAILLSGGSAFGLDAATGVVRFLEERAYGHRVSAQGLVIPIVPAAVIYDLTIGNPKVRPDAQGGYEACQAATGGPVEEGSVGAGTGATVGKARGSEWGVKAGIGTASIRLLGDTIVGALMVVNALGDVVDPDDGTIVAGVRDSQSGLFAGAEKVLRADLAGDTSSVMNTVIGVVATNAPLTKGQANRLADVAHDGIARAIRPSHTLFDGDTMFALSLPGDGIPIPDPLRLCAIGGAAAEAVSLAILRAVRLATSLGGVLSAQDLAAAR